VMLILIQYFINWRDFYFSIDPGCLNQGKVKERLPTFVPKNKRKKDCLPFF